MAMKIKLSVVDYGQKHTDYSRRGLANRFWGKS